MTEPSPNSTRASSLSWSAGFRLASGQRQRRSRGGRMERSEPRDPKQRKKIENERIRSSGENRGKNLLPFSASLFLRLSLPVFCSPRPSTPRRSRRGLITAYHCCHGNSRSVKNSSALTQIVRLKFHGERVAATPPMTPEDPGQ